MTKETELLSVTSSPDGTEVTVHLDKAGLEALISRLQLLLRTHAKGDCEHIHLMSQSWGLGDLSETMLEDEKKQQHRQVHHLKIYAWTEAWRKKHGL
jgi:hypothetical protein